MRTSGRMATVLASWIVFFGAGAQEEDILFAYPMTGHYRIGADQAARLRSLTE